MIFSMRFLVIFSAFFSLSLFGQVPLPEPLPALGYQFDQHGNIIDDGTFQYATFRSSTGCEKLIYQDGVFQGFDEGAPCAMAGGFLSRKLGKRSGPARPQTQSPVLSRGTFGSNIGAVALTPIRQNHDPRPLFLATAASNTFGETDNLYLFTPAGDDGHMEQVWQLVSDADTSAPIRDVQVLADYEDGNDAILVARTNGNITLHRPFAGEALASLTLPDPSDLVNAVLADLEGLDQETLLIRVADRVLFVDPTSLLERRAPLSLAGRGAIQVANLDQDADLEFLIADETTPRIHDLDGSLVTNLSQPLGAFYGVADVTGDGQTELVCSGTELGYFDLNNYSFNRLGFPSSDDFNSYLLADLNGDGATDIITGSRHWDGIRAYDLAAGRNLNRISSGGYGVDGMMIADGRFFWTTGAGSTATDRLQEVPVGDLLLGATPSDPVRSPALDGPFTALQTTDTDQGGELLIATQNGDCNGGTVMILNAANGRRKELWTAATPTFNGLRIQDALTANLDADANMELAMLVVQGDRSGVVIIDRVTGMVELERYESPHAQRGNPEGGSLRAANVSAQPGTELIVAYNHRVLVLAAGSFDTLYRYTVSTHGVITAVDTGSIDGTEVQSLFHNEGSHFLRWALVDQPEQNQLIPAQNIRSVFALSATDLTQPQVAVGSTTGTLAIYDNFYSDQGFFHVFDQAAPITAITPFPRPNGEPGWAVTGPSLAYGMANDLTQTLWQQDHVDRYTEKRLTTVDSNGNGTKEVVMAGRYGVVSWEFESCNNETDWQAWRAGLTVLDLVSRLNCSFGPIAR